MTIRSSDHMHKNIETFPLLYKQDTKDSIRQWNSEITYSDDQSQAAIRTNAGVVGGKIMISEWKAVQGKNTGKKNATNAYTQAKAEVEATYKKRLEGSYTFSSTGESSSTAFSPMLAHKYDRSIFSSGQVLFAQPKLDGIRCIASKDGFFTRSNKKHMAIPHIVEALAPLFAQYPNLVLDGELYSHRLHDNFNKIASHVRKTKPTSEDLLISREAIEFHVYDHFFKDMPNLSFFDRFVASNIAYSEYVVKVFTASVSSEDELNNLYSEWLEDGYEGQMVRTNTPYEHKRTNALLKRKEFIDEEFDVVAVEAGAGNWQRAVKRFRLRNNEVNDKVFGAGVRGSFESLQALLESGKTPAWAKVRFFCRSADDHIPRFGVVLDWGFGKRED